LSYEAALNSSGAVIEHFANVSLACIIHMEVDPSIERFAGLSRTCLSVIANVCPDELEPEIGCTSSAERELNGRFTCPYGVDF